MGTKTYFVYVAASPSQTIYVGVTNDLERRIAQHKHKELPGFTRRYNVTRLVYFETFSEITDAISRETQIKGLRREKKIALIESMNPNWNDLSEENYW